ncbi:O-methyltransferase [Chondromyces apiculatus DSM 436]|uniref:O-methyltransferase n=2 Tax=Chondromyces apiculatus TaxID=51 RepID=A0A017T6D0_9BACT|nr:O-methyltransferase [Chondromyces apiculatus DSM 436]
MKSFEGADLHEQMVKLVQREQTEYREMYRTYADNFLSVSPQLGRFLYSCVRACKPTRIVEFGTSMGISAIYMACALRDNGGGVLLGTELEPSKAARARENLSAAGLADFLDLRVGDALETLRDLDAPVDMLLLDGALTLYHPVLKLLEPRLRTGALIIGENAIEGIGPYLEYVRNPGNGYFSQPIPFQDARGNEFTVVTR